jgi:hypothetical protein
MKPGQDLLAGGKDACSTSHPGAMFAHRVSHEEELSLIEYQESQVDLRSYVVVYNHPMTSLDEEKNFSTSRLAKRLGLL